MEKQETETGNGSWKWKLETKGTKDSPITGAMFSSYSVLSPYTRVFYLAIVTGLAL